MNLRTRTLSLLDELNQKFFERDEVIRLMLLAQYSQKNMFLIGIPGTGKTQLIKMLFNSLKGARFWSLLFNKTTKVEQVFGEEIYIDGTATYSTKGTALDAHILFFDEMFKASNSLLNSFLQLLAEKTYSEGGIDVKTPVVTVYGASNELPTGADIAPFSDRFLIWYDVPRIKKEENIKKFLLNQFNTDKKIQHPIELVELEIIKKQASEIPITDEFFKMFFLIKNALTKANSTSAGQSLSEISDRKYGYIMETIRVATVVNEDATPNDSYLLLLIHMTWQTYAEKKRVREIVYDCLFSNNVYLDGQIIKLENEFFKKQSICNSFNIYIEHKIYFKPNFTYNTFEELYQLVLKYYHEIASEYKIIQKIIAKKKYNDELEVLIEKNIFLPNIKSPSFTKNMIERVNTLNFDYEMMVTRLEKWLTENQTSLQYNELFREKQYQKNAGQLK